MKKMKKIKQEEEEEEEHSKLFLTLMEGYSDSTIPLLSDLRTETAIKAPSPPPPPPPPPSRKRQPRPKPNYSSMEEFNKRRRNQEMEQRKKPISSSKAPLMDIQRREKVTSAYSILQAMVPNIPNKATRTRMVEETISYIQELEEVLKGLKEAQKRKAASSMAPPPLPPTVAVSSYNDFIALKKSIINVVVSGKIAVLGINSEIGNRRFLFTKVVSVFEKYGIEILTATVSVNGEKKMSLSATVLVNGNGEKIEGIKKDLIRLLGF